MHIGLNLIYLVPADSGGTETYARELIPQLVAAAPHAQFTAFVNLEAHRADGPWEMLPVVPVAVDARSRAQWVRGEQMLLPKLAAQAGVDLVHSLANTGPLWGRFARVVTIHDLHFRLVPEAHLGLKAKGMRVLVPLTAKRSDRIIVPAAATRADLERLEGITAAKVDVVPEGGGTLPQVAPMPERELRAWLEADERPIVLSVSAKRPHKNIARLISAVSSIPPAQRPLLVIPGYQTPHELELRRHVAQLAMTNDVRLLGWISDRELEGLYAASCCLVCPSLHEGFGLPVLEAMARGLPVACSSRGALPEVAAGAAMMFDPESVPEIAAAIESLLGDRSQRERLRAAGLERASRYTWEAAAAGTLACYERALASAS